MLLAASLLGACSEKQAAPVPIVKPKAVAAPAATAATKASAAAAASTPPTAEELLEAELMTVLFGDKYRRASGDALATLPDAEHRATLSTYIVTPYSAKFLSDDVAVLIANAQFPNENGVDLYSHGQPGFLNVFLLQKSGTQWNVLKRHENVASLGAYGKLGSIEWMTPAGGKPIFGVNQFNMGQGYSMSSLSLFDPRADKLIDLADETIRLDSSNDGACEEESGQCYSVEGKWHLAPAQSAAAYDDIVIDFSGFTPEELPASERDADPPRKPKKLTVNAQARYAYDGKAYRLVGGTNPTK